MSEGRRLPPWLLGMIIAAGVFVVVLLVALLIGLGDNPVVEGLIWG